ncbi:hypothetical protein JY651_50665 [Pyxidicoccus parkwayensis]|jgi:hypothetical protein|uniref:Uncharacterized protein n=1 Tax=Pyxidicoccus parkwayensis TaxID=2813578 RepID=A0ABX7NWE8_9BACT|nr:hypothetical protein [Pyxidicoccus parkwaysis]QSQ23252.1 hypothetical protein JY651_50665 [Pyxidicoccus parkwaysis]
MSSTIRWALWGTLVTLHVLATVRPPEAIGFAVGGAVYAPLMVLEAVGLPVYGRHDSGGWAHPSWLGWALVAVLWAAVWWGVAWLVSRLLPQPEMLRSR